MERTNADTFLKEQVFGPVAKRLMGRADSLKEVGSGRFPRTGIEGWLKVEAVAALGDHVEKLQNKGPDLRLRDGLCIELKAATNCEANWILGGLKYRAQPLACLFMGSGSGKNISSCVKRLQRDSRMVAHEIFSVGTHHWIIGLIVRREGRP